MPNYKVGDVATLFPAPPIKGSGTNLQSLFNNHYKKDSVRTSNNSTKKGVKRKADTNTSQTGIVKVEPERVSYIKDIKSEKVSTRKKKETIKKPSEDLPDPPVPMKKYKFNKPAGNLTDEAASVSDNMMQKKVPSHNLYIPKGQYNSGNDENRRFSKKHVKKQLKETENNHSVADLTNNISKSPTNTKIKLNKGLKKKKVIFKEPINHFNRSKYRDNINEQDDRESPNDNQPVVKEIKSQDKGDLSCTLFIGNLPISVTKKELLKLFRPFGSLKTVRLRGAIPSKSTIPKRVAEIKNKYHKSVQSHKGFVVFKTPEEAKNAISLNGTLIGNHHILVDFATDVGEKKKYDEKLSIFIGNLPFDIDDEAVWAAFEDCGEIQAVRVIRDRDTGAGKGFGYVLFQNNRSKETALAKDDLEINGRKIRIKPVNSQQIRGSKETVKMIRNNVAFKRRSKESGGKKSVKKLLKKERRFHRNKQIAHMFGEKFVK